MDKRIEHLLDIMPFEELLDYNDVTIVECVEALINHGIIDWPDFYQPILGEDDED